MTHTFTGGAPYRRSPRRGKQPAGSDAAKETKRGSIPLILAVPLLAIAAFIIFFISFPEKEKKVYL